MRFIFKVLLFLLQIVVFYAVAGVSSKAFSHLTAKDYLAGEAPLSVFPVVAVLGGDSDSRAPQYRLLAWHQLDEAKSKEQPISFRLPQNEGHFELAKQGEWVPRVSFKVLESAQNGQLIEVESKTDDYDIVGRYFTDGSSIQPKYFYIWGASTIMIGIIPGLIGGWFVGKRVRRKWPQYFDAPSQS